MYYPWHEASEERVARLVCDIDVYKRQDYDYVLTGREQNQIHVVAENPDELGEKRIAAVSYTHLRARISCGFVKNAIMI